MLIIYCLSRETIMVIKSLYRQFFTLVLLLCSDMLLINALHHLLVGDKDPRTDWRDHCGA